MPAARRRTLDHVDLSSGRATQTVLLAVLVGTALVFWRAIGEPFQLPKLTILVVGAVVALVTTALDAIGNRGLEVPARPVAVALGLFAVGLVVSVVTSTLPAHSIVGGYGVNAGLLAYLAGLVLAVAAVASFDDDGARRFQTVVVVVAVLVSLYAFVQVLDADPFTWLRDTKVFSTFGNADYASGWLGAALPIAAGWAWLRGGTTQGRVLGIGAVVVLAAAVLATGSYQGIPAAAAGLLVWALAMVLPHRSAIAAWRRDLTGRTRTAVTAGAVALVVAAVGFLVALPGALDQGLLERKFFWRAALDVFRDHPLVGSGLDTFGNEFFPHRAAEHALRYGSSSAEATHSVPLAMLSGGGLVLGVTYLLVLVAVGVTLFVGLRQLTGRRRTLGASLVGAWVAFQVQSFVSIDVPSMIAFGWLLSGVALAVVTPATWRARVGAPAVERDKRGREVARTWRPASPIVVALLVAVAVVVAWQSLRPIRADLAAADATRLGRSEDAAAQAATIRKQLESARHLAPWEGRYALAEASFYNAVSNPPLAVEAAKKGAELEPGRPNYALTLAGLYRRVGERAQAVRWYRNAVDRDPNSYETVSAAAVGLDDLGRYGEALELVQRWQALKPEVAASWLELGRAQLGLHREAEAKRSFDKALALDPGLQPQVDALLASAP